MTVSNGRQFLSIPGPTNVPDKVLQPMHRPAIDLYSGDMLGITASLVYQVATRPIRARLDHEAATATAVAGN